MAFSGLIGWVGRSSSGLSILVKLEKFRAKGRKRGLPPRATNELMIQLNQLVRDGVFQNWITFLDKHFPNMDPGFTIFFLFEFKNEVVKYQELNQDGKAVTVKSRVFCADPVGTRKIILRELFNLNSTSDAVEICKAKPRLPPLPQKRISQKKVDNMKVLYQQIPRNFRWYYPEGEE